MSVVEHIPPAHCLAPLKASPLTGFSTEGPGFIAGSCEEAVFAAVNSLQSVADCSQVGFRV